jgi:cytoskeleton protein RodZ
VSTEDIDKPSQHTEQGGGLEAVGSRLAAARRQQKLEPGAVASRLHLTVDVVTAIEAGDLSALPAMTFVRGYIKSYARLVGLDEQQVLTLLPTGESYRPAPLRAVGMSRARRHRPIGKWLVWALGVAALVVVVVYGVPVVERLLTRSAQPVDDNALPLPLGEQGIELEPLLPDESAPNDEEEPAVVPESEYDAGDEPAADLAVVEEQPTPPESSSPAPSEPSVPPEPPATPVAADTSGPAMITLRFSEDSWVEMESHGRKLVVGTQPAGSERSIRAEPPVQLLLGNAPGVTLEFRGRPVDLEPHQRGKVARLILED